MLDPFPSWRPPSACKRLQGARPCRAARFEQEQEQRSCAGAYRRHGRNLFWLALGCCQPTTASGMAFHHGHMLKIFDLDRRDTCRFSFCPEIVIVVSALADDQPDERPETVAPFRSEGFSPTVLPVPRVVFCATARAGILLILWPLRQIPVRFSLNVSSHWLVWHSTPSLSGAVTSNFTGTHLTLARLPVGGRPTFDTMMLAPGHLTW